MLLKNLGIFSSFLVPKFPKNLRLGDFWLIYIVDHKIFKIFENFRNFLISKIFDLENDPFWVIFQNQKFRKIFEISKIPDPEIFAPKISKMKFCLHSKTHFRRL